MRMGQDVRVGGASLKNVKGEANISLSANDYNSST